MSLGGGCGSPDYNSIILHDELAFRTGVTPKDYQNKGQLRPTMSLSTDAVGNQSLKMADSKGLNASSTAMLAPPHVSSVGARDAWVQVNSGNVNVTEILAPTKKQDGTVMGEQVAKLLTPDGAATVRVVWPFVVDFNHLQVTWFGATAAFGMLNIGFADTANPPNFSGKLIDCAGNVIPANAISIANMEDGKIVPQYLKFSDFFGAGNPSTAVFSPMGIANITLEFTFGIGSSNVLLGTTSLGTDQRALVPA